MPSAQAQLAGCEDDMGYAEHGVCGPLLFAHVSAEHCGAWQKECTSSVQKTLIVLQKAQLMCLPRQQ